MAESQKKQREIVFLRNRKCAGTSICRYASERDLPLTTVTWKAAPEFLESLRHASEKPIIFTVVRNPYDKMVSLYTFAKQRKLIERSMSFAKFAALSFEAMKIEGNGVTAKGANPAALWGHSMPYCDYLPDENCGIDYIDHVLHLESLEEEFAALCRKIGWPNDGLPPLNVTARLPYAHYYDEESRRHVTNKYMKDLELFGYVFEDNRFGFFRQIPFYISRTTHSLRYRFSHRYHESIRLFRTQFPGVHSFLCKLLRRSK